MYADSIEKWYFVKKEGKTYCVLEKVWYNTYIFTIIKLPYMSEMQRLDNVPSIPKPCSPEEGKLLEAGGEMTKTLIHAMFHNRTKRISQRDFALGLNQIL